MTTYDSATGAKTATPDRPAVESVLGQALLDWQWDVLLGILGHLPTRPASESKPLPEKLAELTKPTTLTQLRNHAAFQHTCIVCGRVGSRRYQQTPSGWRCTNRDACERRGQDNAAAAQAVGEPTPPEPTGVRGLCIDCGAIGEHDCQPKNDDDHQAHPHVTLTPDDTTETAPAIEDAPPPPTPAATPGVTARCSDCTRTWTLTGRDLTNAINMHEFRANHIVVVLKEGSNA